MTEYTCFIFRKVGEHIEFVLTDINPGKYLAPVIDIDENNEEALKNFLNQMEELGLRIKDPDQHIVPFGKDWKKNKACMLVRVDIFPLRFPMELHVREIQEVFNNIDHSQGLQFYKMIEKLQQYSLFKKMDLEFFQKLDDLRKVK
ncbi:MAG: hypothetical protein WC933_02445 [Candidatus Paceibacterota bacterium]|jgi:hypothetical protein